MSRAFVLRTIFWLAAIFAFVMAVLPHPPRLPGAPSDKVQHIAAFLALGALAFFAYPRSSLVRLGIALSTFGAIIEIVQLIPALNRDGDLVDWIADTVAAASMLFVLRWLRARRTGAVAREK